MGAEGMVNGSGPVEKPSADTGGRTPAQPHLTSASLVNHLLAMFPELALLLVTFGPPHALPST